MTQNSIKKGLITSSLRMIAIAAIILTCCSSCNKGEQTPNDTKYLQDFHEAYFPSQENELQPNQLALYVDYSTCIYEAAVQGKSAFFNAIKTPLTNECKQYYSIQGEDIVREEAINDQYYFNLQKVRNDIPYANLKKAVDQIANGNTEAVLMTDGEYILPPQSRASSTDPFNKDNAYMKSAFVEWLKKGHDIYIFAEPYQEGKYAKKRFYFIFTDTRMRGNIYDNIINRIVLGNYPEISQYHLSSNLPPIFGEGNNASKANEIFQSRHQGLGEYEIQDWTNMRWKDIEELIIAAVDPQTGEPLPNGDAVITGIQIDKNYNGGCFRIEDIDLVVTNINEEYNTFYYEREGGKKLEQIAKNIPISPSTHENFLLLDHNEFKKHSEVKVYFDAQYYNPELLDGSPYNYFKIDFVIKSYNNNFANAETIFKFQSMNDGSDNNSIVKSIKGAIEDQPIKDMMNGKVLYSIYVKSNKY